VGDAGISSPFRRDGELLTRTGPGNADKDQHPSDGQRPTHRHANVALHDRWLLDAAAFGRQWAVRHRPIHYRRDPNYFGRAARAAPGQPSHVRAHGYSTPDH